MEEVKGKFDIEVGFDLTTKEPIILTEQARMLHQMFIGPSGSGARNYSILHQVKQDLKRISHGNKAGLVVLDTRDDMLKEIAKESESIGVQLINILDLSQAITHLTVDPFKGPARVVGTNFKEILSSVMGDQDEYFRGNQEEFVFFCILLGKTRFGNSFDLPIFLRMISEPRYLAVIVDEVRRYGAVFSDEEPVHNDLDQIIHYFDNEVLNFIWMESDNPYEREAISYPAGHKYEGMQMVENRKERYLLGVKTCLNHVLSNPNLAACLVPREGSMDLDDFLAGLMNNGGVLLINTGYSHESLFMGKLIAQKVQNAAFNRSAFTARIPVFLYVNDTNTFKNHGLVHLVSLGRSYKVGVVCSVHRLRDCEHDVDGSSLLHNIRHKVIYGGLESNDAKRLISMLPQVYSEEGIRTAITQEEIATLDFRNFYIDFHNDSSNTAELRKAFI